MLKKWGVTTRFVRCWRICAGPGYCSSISNYVGQVITNTDMGHVKYLFQQKCIDKRPKNKER